MTREKAVFGVGALAILLGGLFYWRTYQERLTPADAGGETPTYADIPGIQYGYASASSPTSTPSATEGTKEKEVPSRPIPDLNRPIVAPNDFSAADAADAAATIRQLTEILSKNTENTAVWIGLGLQRKSIEDYEGARQAWEYAYALDPRNAITADNLGVLYGYYLKDSRKAETYFLTAISLEPRDTFRYERAVEFYREVLLNDAKARNIASDGVQRVTNPASLKEFLGE